MIFLIHMMNQKQKKKIKLPKNDLEAIDYDLAALEDENYDYQYKQ